MPYSRINPTRGRIAKEETKRKRERGVQKEKVKK
jgi:hypothetical protein